MTALNRKFEFSQPTGKYKTHVNSGDWKAYTAARFQISMNNPKHAADKFYAQAEWAAARFDRVQLIVSDTLYRYNIMASHGVDEAAARRLALQIGDQWLADNAAAIALLPNHTVTRWDDWLRYPNFAAAHDQMKQCYLNDPTFARAVDSTVQLFLRNKDGLTDAQRAEYTALSHAYLIEELAVFAVMYTAAPMVDVRPGSPIKPVLDLLKSGAVCGAPSGCGGQENVIIDFTRNKGF